MTRYLVGDRQTGRTTALVHWLLGGHRVSGWPQWSRVLVLPDAHQLRGVYERYPEVHGRLRHGGCVGGLGKVLVTAREVGGIRGCDPDVRFAVDNLDMVECPFELHWVDLASVLGSTVTAADIIAESGGYVGGS